VPLRDRPHQRRLAVRRLDGIDIGAARNQRFDRTQAAAPGGGHQGGHPGRGGGIGIGAGRQQPLDDLDAAVFARQRERTDAMVVDRVGAGA
jgi:hypothetical protein